MKVEDTGLTYFWNRWYDSKAGRWMSEDPVRQKGGVNYYEYSGNKPIEASDYNGLNWYYSQGTGEFSHPPLETFIAPSGDQISSDQSIPGVGPIPLGDWSIIGPPRDYSFYNGPQITKTLHHALYLSPSSSTITYGRTGFYIHGGTITEGCILVQPTLRDEIWNSGDHDLTVIP